MRKYITFAVMLMALLVTFGCASKEAPDSAPAETDSTVTIEGPKPVVTIAFEDMEDIQVELYPSVAPNTVNNFISLVESGFYDGVIFHRVIEGFMIQGGDPDGVGTGGPGYAIKGEFSENGFDNALSHKRGVISMARSMAPDSAGSQFFIMHQDTPQLDGKYAAFGKVISGIETVDQIASVETGANDRPVEDIVMQQVTVELNGYEAQEPEKLDE